MQASPRTSGASGPAVGIEVAGAGTRITALVETSQGIRSATQRGPAPPTPEEAVDQIAGLVAELAASTGQSVAGVGIAVDGRVDAASGVVHTLHFAAEWEDVNLAERVAAAIHAPVRLDSATNAAALAEAQRGAGAESSHVLYVLPAQSVTAAYVVKGCIVQGASGMQGQLGHLKVRDGGPRCSCGASGHLEPLASAQAIVRNMIGRAAGSSESTAAMLRASGRRAEALSAVQVVRLAQEREPAAHTVLADALDALAEALACAVALLDSAVIVLGGPLTQAGSWYFDQLEATLREKRQPFATPPLVAGSLEPRAVLLGAALLAASPAPDATYNGATEGDRGIIPEM